MTLFIGLKYWPERKFTFLKDVAEAVWTPVGGPRAAGAGAADRGRVSGWAAPRARPRGLPALCDQRHLLGGPGQAVHRARVRAARASSVRPALPGCLGQPQENMYFGQNGSLLRPVTPLVKAQLTPGQLCILNSSLVTTKNRCPSPQPSLLPGRGPAWTGAASPGPGPDHASSGNRSREGRGGGGREHVRPAHSGPLPGPAEPWGDGAVTRDVQVGLVAA